MTAFYTYGYFPRPRHNARIGKVTWKSQLVRVRGDRWEWISGDEAERRWKERKLNEMPPVRRAPSMQQDVFGIWNVQ